MTQSKDSHSGKESSPGSLDAIEQKMDALQSRLFLGVVIGTGALALQHMVISVHANGWIGVAFTLLSLVGWAIFGLSVLRMKKLGRSKEGKAYAANAGGDERLKQLRSEAFAFGFWALLGFQVFILIAWTFFHDMHNGLLSAPVVAPTAIAIGVSASLIRFQILSKH